MVRTGIRFLDWGYLGESLDFQTPRQGLLRAVRSARTPRTHLSRSTCRASHDNPHGCHCRVVGGSAANCRVPRKERGWGPSASDPSTKTGRFRDIRDRVKSPGKGTSFPSTAHGFTHPPQQDWESPWHACLCCHLQTQLGFRGGLGSLQDLLPLSLPLPGFVGK